MPDAYGALTVSHGHCDDNYRHTKPPQAKKLDFFFSFFPSANYGLLDGAINTTAMWRQRRQRGVRVGGWSEGA